MKIFSNGLKWMEIMEKIFKNFIILNLFIICIRICIICILIINEIFIFWFILNLFTLEEEWFYYKVRKILNELKRIVGMY